MIKRFNVYFDGKLMGQVQSVSENGATQKAAELVMISTGMARSASAYSGLSTNRIRVVAQ